MPGCQALGRKDIDPKVLYGYKRSLSVARWTTEQKKFDLRKDDTVTVRDLSHWIRRPRR